MTGTTDADFMRDLQAAMVRPPRLSANLLLLAIVALFAWAVWWASQARLDVVTTGLGKVIPSSDIQVVQNLEGGIVRAILVREGQAVEKGQPLMQIDDTQFRSTYQEDRTQYLGRLAVAARLRAEVSDAALIFPAAVLAERPQLVASETSLMQARSRELESGLAVLARQRDQKRQELVELDSRITQLRESLNLAREEVSIMEPLVQRGVVSRVELLRIRRQISDIEGGLKGAEQAVPRAQSALREVDQRMDEARAQFRAKAIAELNETELKLSGLEETMAAKQDRLTRTDVLSPVAGVIKQVSVKTVGGVVKPGMDLVEIVPRDDTLLIEARVAPRDIAFLVPGQAAKVKLTAYDYAIYGSLDGRLEQISADTIIDPQGNSFYEIRVRTDENALGTEATPLPILPGMVAEVDVLTGQRTVLEYLLKPILRARQKALRER